MLDGTKKASDEEKSQRDNNTFEDFSLSLNNIIPETSPEVRQAIQNRDAQALTEILENRLNTYVSPETTRRLNNLVNDRLINDREFESVLARKNVDNLDKLLDRLETIEQPKLREERIASATPLDELKEEYDLEILGLTFKEEEQLETLLEEGGIDPNGVKEAIIEGDGIGLQEEIERRWSDREAERTFTGERVRENI